ncbi:MAG: hypothetical protein M0T70_05745 [Geobacteraceae bacterium]|nr:hypothetical protein [Geobacteraceae bacterium]
MKLVTKALFATLALAPPALAGQGPGSYAIVSDVISGGGQEVSGGGYTLNGTIGQSSAIGLSTGTSYSNQGGFWNLRSGDTIAPTTPIFALQSPSRSYTVPITTLTSTDAGSGVTGYYISAAPTPPTDPWGTGWAAPTPASLISTTKGLNQTFYVWARDAAGNISGGASASTDIIFQWLLSVAFGGTGGASITSAPGTIACMAGLPANCSANFDEGTTVTLTAAPDIRSQPSSWTGSDSSTFNTASVTMNSDRTVTASFETVPNIARIVYDRGYDSLPAAIAALATSATIQARDTYPGSLIENLVFNRNYTVNLNGGMDANWDPTVNYTSVKGTLTISQGKVIANRIKIHP